MVLHHGACAGSKGVEPLVTILDITTDITQSGASSAYRSGSIYGGTVLYIKASGHSPIASENRVTIGPYACVHDSKLDTSASPLYVVCVTRAAIYADRRWSQEVIVHTAGRPDSKCLAGHGCLFSFSESYTPVLYSIIPRSASASETVYWYGVANVNNMNKVKEMVVNGQRCELDELKQGQPDALNINEEITSWARYPFTCRLSKEIEAGYFSSNFKTVFGNSRRLAILPSKGGYASPVNYDFTNVPDVKTVSTTTAGNNGALLTLTGTGFTTDKSKITVTAGGLACDVKESTNTKIVCKVANGDSVSSAINIGGGGAIYKKYTALGKSTTQAFKDHLDANPGLTAAYAGVMGEVDLYTTEKDTYHYWSGIFVPKRTGQYKFFVNSGDRIAAYISTTHQGAVPAAATVYRTYGNTFRVPLRNQVDTAFSTAFVALTAGEEYRFEVYGINNADFGHFSLGMIEQSATPAVNSVPWVVNFKVTYDPIREKITITSALTAGTFTFGFKDTVPASTTYTPRTNTKTYNWDASCDDVMNGMRYNSLKLLCDRTAEGAGFKWVITVNEYREDFKTMVPAGGSGASVLDEPSTDPIGGTYKIKYNTATGTVYLKVDGKEDIPYNANAWDLNWAIKGALDLETLFDWQWGKAYDGIDHYVQIYTEGQPIPTFVVEYAGTLTGRSARVDYSVVHTAANDIELNSISHEYLKYEAAAPSVLVTVNEVFGKCSAPVCTYTAVAANQKTYSGLVWNGATKKLTLVLDNISNTQVIASMLNIEFGNAKCIKPSISGSPSATVICSIWMDRLGNQFIEGGNNLPAVSINQSGALAGYGYLTTTESPIVLTPTITALSETAGGSNGGTTVKITGTYFPLEGSLTPFKVLFGAVQATTIISKTPLLIVVESPAGTAGAVQVTVEVNSVASAGTTFTYNSDNVLLSDNSVPSASPVLKTPGVLTGTGFGTNKNQLEVILRPVNPLLNQEYTLLVKTVNGAGTEIEYTLIGGHKGDFKIHVKRKGYGISNGLDFKYELKVTGVTPLTGSIAGGTELTITGLNFSTDKLENNVFLGSLAGFDNKICHVTSATATEIKCLTPTGYDWQVEGQANVQSIIVQGRLIEDADYAPAVYEFTYTNGAGTPKIAKPASTSFKAGDSVSLTGVNLAGAKIYLGEIEVTPVTAAATTVDFTFPALSAGKYPLRVYISNVGDAILGEVTDLWNGEISNNFWVGNATPSTGSSAGHIITVAVNGLDALKKPKVVFATNGECSYISHTQSSVVCRTPQITGADTLSVIHDITVPVTSQVKLAGGTYTGAAAGAPTISSSTKTVTGITTEVAVVGTSLTGASNSAVFELKTNRNIAYAGTISAPTATSATVSVDNLPAGEYVLRFFVTDKGFAVNTMNPEFTVNVILSPSVASTYEASIAGGQTLTIQGTGFSATPAENTVTIGGLDCPVTAATASEIQCKVPLFSTQLTKNLYNFPENESKVEPQLQFSNEASTDAYLLMDGAVDEYFSSGATDCHVGYDFGKVRVGITQIQFFPRSKGLNSASSHKGGIFEGSVDGVTWTLIRQLPSAHLGKNLYRPSLETTPFRFIRYRNNRPAFPLSNCELAELEVFGNIYSSEEFSGSITNSNAQKTLSAEVTVNGVSFTVPSAVKYINANSKTPIVTQISPKFGSIKGNTDVTFTGSNLVPTGAVIADYAIVIDGFDCAVQSVSEANNQVVCKTAEKTSATASSLVVTYQGFTAVTSGVAFYYGLLWSEWNIWGSEPKPKTGDSVYVAKNTVMIVDEPVINALDDTQIVLQAMIVEGTLMFIDQANIDVTFDARYILIKGDGKGQGNLIIGTETDPYDQGTLTITMHGNFWDSQLPDVGNKGIACMLCHLDIHGKPVEKTWTELSASANAGDDQITVFGNLQDWKVGDDIVIASTDFHHEHAEQRTITEITPGATTTVIKFNPDEPLQWYHHSGVETTQNYQGVNVDFPMRAEVGLLTRNVRIQGDDDSEKDKYGAHMMMHGKAEKGLRARIEYAEFTKVGQPAIIGRYPIHFHMNGDVSNSYVRGNAVHHSFARVTTIHAVQYLRILKNVGYDAAGHNFFFEDGIEEHNVLEENLAIHTRQVWSMLQSDITAASFWVTNPNNELRNNRAAGGDFYGFWYEVKEHPDGPSATNDICPQGMPVGDFDGNKAHSYVRFGLRVFVLTERENPCEPTRDDSLPTPYSANPSSTIYWKNFETFKNQEDGVLCEFCGDMIFQNFKAADNKQSSFNVHRANFTEKPVKLENWVIVGKSSNNIEEEVTSNSNFYAKSRGIIVPRTDGFLAEKIGFNKFIDGTRPLQSCSECYHFKKWGQGGKEAFFKQIHYDTLANTPNMVFWENWRNAIFVDLDGTLTGNSGPRWVTARMAHLEQVTGCTPAANWDDGIICEKRLTRLDFFAPVPEQEFRGINLQVVTVSTKTGVIDPADAANLPKMTNSQSKKIKNKEKDNDMGFVAVLAAGNKYNIKFNSAPDEWRAGIDWRHFLVKIAEGWKPEHEGIIVEFSYIDVRELFEMYRMIGRRLDKDAADIPGNKPVKQLETEEEKARMTTDLCQFGDFIHDEDKRTLTVCISGKGLVSSFDGLDMNGLPCKLACPVPSADCVKETRARKWHVPSDWYHYYDAKNPTAFIDYGTAANKTVLCEWRMFIEPNELNVIDVTAANLTIRGSLRFNNINENTQIHIKSSGINIWGGQFVLGEPDAPFLGEAIIEMQGVQTDKTPFVYDSVIDVGNKVIGVTGLFQLIGKPTPNSWTRLVSYDSVSGNTITVENAAGFQVGDTLVISTSSAKANEFDRVVIQSVSGNTITFASKLQYWHYGSTDKTTVSKTFKNPDGEPITQSLDMRAVVGKVNRNIKIQGNYVDDWGCRIFIYRLQITEALGVALTDDQKIDWQGVLNFDGVEIENCGQRDTTRGAIDFRKMDAQPDELLQNGVVAERTKQTAQSVVINSAIHDCQGYCWNSEESNMWEAKNNVFFNGRPIIMGVTSDGNDVTITGNAFIAALQRNYVFVEGSLYDMKAFIYWYQAFSVKEGRSKVYGNVGQGSDGPGFVFPHVPCADRLETINNKWGFFDNEAVSTVVGFMYQKQGPTCQWAGRNSAAISGRGLMVNPTVPGGIIVEYVIAVENERGVILRFATPGNDRKGFFRNSYISGVARPKCPLCYVQSRSMCDGLGVQMLVVTDGGEDFPLKNHPFVFDVICNSQTFDSRMYVNDVVFENYKQKFSELPTCGGGHAWATHPGASDMTAGHYLWNVDCINCDHESKVHFRSPSKSWLGWFGGCGEFLCTGPDNVILHDWTGRFLNTNVDDVTQTYPTRQAIAHNELVGDQLSYCKRIVGWNGGYDCEGSRMSIFQFESIAPDRQARMHAPVQMHTDMVTVTDQQVDALDTNAGVFNRINAFREWVWDGPEPMNKRENRFIALAQLDSPYNVTYNGLNPYDIIHKINDRTVHPEGEPDNHVVFQYHYQVPLSIKVYFDPPFVDPVTKKSISIVKPVQLHEGAAYPLLNLKECGHNQYFFKNSTIHFVVTGARGCHVQVALIDSVWVTIRLQTSVSDFYNSDKDTKFIDRIGAFLNITTDQLKIVSAFDIKKRVLLRDLQGSPESNVTLVIDHDQPIGSQDSFITYEELQKLAEQLKEGAASLGGDPTVLDVDFLVKVSQDTKTGEIITEEEFKRKQAGDQNVEVLQSDGDGLTEDETVLAIVLAVVLGLIFIIALVGCYCVYKKYQQKKLEEAQANQVIYLNESNDQSKQVLQPHESGLRQGVKLNDDAPLQMPGTSVVDKQNEIPDF